ncbi:hypothetical protein Tco_0553067 [Tanacetum coccineum]
MQEDDEEDPEEIQPTILPTRGVVDDDEIQRGGALVLLDPTVVALFSDRVHTLLIALWTVYYNITFLGCPSDHHGVSSRSLFRGSCMRDCKRPRRTTPVLDRGGEEFGSWTPDLIGPSTDALPLWIERRPDYRSAWARSLDACDQSPKDVKSLKALNDRACRDSWDHAKDLPEPEYQGRPVASTLDWVLFRSSVQSCYVLSGYYS